MPRARRYALCGRRTVLLCIGLLAVGLFLHHTNDDFEGAGDLWSKVNKVAQGTVFLKSSTMNKVAQGTVFSKSSTTSSQPEPVSMSFEEASKVSGSNLPETFIGTLEANKPAVEVTHGATATITKMLKMNGGNLSPPIWYKSRSRVGNYAWLQHVCIRGEGHTTTLYAPGVPRQDVLGGGVWGPWKKTHLTLLKGLFNLTDYMEGTTSVYGKDMYTGSTSKYEKLEARWHPEHAILPWFRLNYDANNLYHAIDELGPVVGFVRMIEDHINKCAATGAVVFRQGLERMHDSLEMRLFKAGAGVINAYKLERSERNIVHCFRGAWLPVKVPGLKPPDPDVPYTITEPAPLEATNWRSSWQKALGLEARKPNSTIVWDYCNSPASVPQITIIQRQNTRRILNLDYVVVAFKKRGWHVTVAHLEELSVTEQFLMMQNTTTLIGVHGAGLAWARLLPSEAAEIQVIGLPCSLESPSKQNFVSAKRYRILPSSLDAINTEVDEAATKRYCEVLRRSNDMGMKNKAALSADELRILDGSSIFDTGIGTADVRKYEAILSIPDVVRTVSEIDPVLNPPSTENCPKKKRKSSGKPGPLAMVAPEVPYDYEEKADWKCSDLGIF